MTRTAATAIVCACLLLTTGCVGLLDDSPQTTTEPAESTATDVTTTARESDATATTTTTAAESDDVVAVTGGEFAYDVDAIWRRVQSQLGTDLPPPSVAVQENPLGASYSGGQVVIDPSIARRDSEPILAHEFAHYVQNTAGPWPGRFPEHRDQQFAVAAYKEGFAMYVEDRYRDEYGYESVDSRDVVDSSPRSRWYSARYVRGLEYVQYRVNHTDELGPLLGGAYPNTSEQVLHPELGAEPAEPLLVRPARVNREGYSEFLPLRTPKRFGELAIRITIWSRTNQSAAERAGSGWGNDRLLTFQGPNDGGHAWVIRFDDAAEAREARSLFRAYRRGDPREFDDAPGPVEQTTELDSRLLNGFMYADGSRSFSTEMVDSETLVVFVGSRSFVSNASASGNSGNVTIRVAEDDTNASAVTVAGPTRMHAIVLPENVPDERGAKTEAVVMCAPRSDAAG